MLFPIHAIFVYFTFIFKAIHIFISIWHIHDLFFRFTAARTFILLIFIISHLIFTIKHLQVFSFLKSKMTTMLSFLFILLNIFFFNRFFRLKYCVVDGWVFDLLIVLLNFVFLTWIFRFIFIQSIFILISVFIKIDSFELLNLQFYFLISIKIILATH